MKLKNSYKTFVISLLLIPNLFVVVLGIESFPYTCAPMFGHYIDNETPLYLFKLEGLNQNKTTDLTAYLGKPEDFFMRHFFSKVYGSTQAISPFSHKLSESQSAFQNRMHVFFEHYTTVLKEKYHLSFEQINIKAIQVDQKRQPRAEPQLLGYYDGLNKTYVSAHQNATPNNQHQNKTQQ
jgi:hypothetical protein